MSLTPVPAELRRLVRERANGRCEYCRVPESVSFAEVGIRTKGSSQGGLTKLPLGWAIHTCVEARRHPEGEFPKVAELLFDNGATIRDRLYPTGHEGLDAVLKRHLR